MEIVDTGMKRRREEQASAGCETIPVPVEGEVRIEQGPQLEQDGSAVGDERLFRELIRYELLNSRRYGRRTTLVGLFAPRLKVDLEPLVRSLFRRSDFLYTESRRRMAILMRDTGSTGANAAIERVREHFLEQLELRASIVSFPDDREDAEGLLRVLMRRLSTSRRSHEANGGEGDATETLKGKCRETNPLVDRNTGQGPSETRRRDRNGH